MWELSLTCLVPQPVVVTLHNWVGSSRANDGSTFCSRLWGLIWEEGLCNLIPISNKVQKAAVLAILNHIEREGRLLAVIIRHVSLWLSPYGFVSVVAGTWKAIKASVLFFFFCVLFACTSKKSTAGEGECNKHPDTRTFSKAIRRDREIDEETVLLQTLVESLLRKWKEGWKKMEHVTL